MEKYEIIGAVEEYGLYEDGELKLILNSKENALFIKEILEEDETRPGEVFHYKSLSEELELSKRIIEYQCGVMNRIRDLVEGLHFYPQKNKLILSSDTSKQDVIEAIAQIKDLFKEEINTEGSDRLLISPIVHKIARSLMKAFCHNVECGKDIHGSCEGCCCLFKEIAWEIFYPGRFQGRRK